VQNHLFQDDFTSILHTESDHGKAVSDQDHIHTRSVGNMCAWEVVSGDHGDWFLLLMERAQCIDGDLFARLG